MLEEEIRLLIEKSLPEQVGRTLKERLAKAESDEKTLKMVEIDLAKSKAIINDLKEQLSKHMILDQRFCMELSEAQKSGEEPIFNMDGSDHFLESKTECCGILGKQCECGGFMHYQAVYGGYGYRCEECDKRE